MFCDYKALSEDKTPKEADYVNEVISLKKPDFLEIIESLRNAMNEKNWVSTLDNLSKLSNFFLEPEFAIFANQPEFQQSNICQDLIEIVDDAEFSIISPTILELFTNIMFSENSPRHFARFIFDNNGLEIIIHCKNTLAEESLPLVYAFAYNIYSFCHKISKRKKHDDLPIVQRTEHLRCFCQDLKRFQQRDFDFIIPLAMIQILRDEIIDNDQFPRKLFFDGLLPLGINPDPVISIYSLWCLYYAFKNSYSVVLLSVPFELSDLLNDKIERMENPNEVKISLFLYCYCFMDCAPNNLKNHFVRNIPIELILQLTTHEDEELAQLAIILCNDYIACDTFARPEFCSANFQLFIELAQQGPTSSKIEAGYLIMTAVSCATREDQPNLFTPEVVEILCDLLQVHNIELVRFLGKMVPLFPQMKELLLSIDFGSQLQYFMETSVNQSYVDQLNILYKILESEEE